MIADNIQFHLPTAMTEASNLNISPDDMALPVKILSNKRF